MNTLKLFFACILLLAGLLVLPFAVIGGSPEGLDPRKQLGILQRIRHARSKIAWKCGNGFPR